MHFSHRSAHSDHRRKAKSLSDNYILAHLMVPTAAFLNEYYTAHMSRSQRAASIIPRQVRDMYALP